MSPILTILACLFLPLFGRDEPAPNPDSIAKEIVTGIEKKIQEIGDGEFVLTTFINGTAEIVSTIKPAKEWDDEYRKSLGVKISLTIRRGGTIFQLLQIQEKEKVLI